jgi:arylsulfatase A-like enzyme/Flp pilus assembly protein TadD
LKVILEPGRKCPALCAVLALALLAGCRRAAETGVIADGAFRGAPVVLISIDTLRSDHLPLYGYKEVETPALAALAEDGVVFERAYSQVPLTLPSHTSLLSGLLPGDHGVRDNVGYRFEASKHPYLPHLLKDAGYRTGAAVSTYVLRGETGLADFFDVYDSTIEVRLNESLGRSQRSGPETLNAARPFLAEAAGKPFFLFFHLYEPHTPYEPPEPYRSRYAKPYDGEIAAADAVVGDLVAELKKGGVYDDALVIVLSDHGEGLGDHGEEEHGLLLYREALQVPLVVKLPKGRRGGTRVAAPVELIDVFPTITALLGLERPKELAGRPLFAAADPGAAPRRLYAETWYPRLHFGWSELSSLIEDRYHYIHGPDPELYDLVADPAEKADVRERERRPFSTLRQAIAGFAEPLAAPAQVDAETARRLASLGYMGSSALAGTGDGPLPDPKSQVHTLAGFGQAMERIARRDYAGSVPLLERVVAENPKMMDAWESLGQSLQKLGRLDEGLAAYEKAMTLSGGAGYVAIATGTLLLEMGRLDEAAEHARLGLPTGPAAARSLLARVALGRGDTAAAEKEAQAALAARGSRVGPLIVLAQVKIEQKQLEEALRLTDEARQELERMEGDASFPGLYQVRGDAFARLGRSDEAEAAFKKEIEVAPGNPAPYARLTGLYAFAGRGPEAIATLRSMVEYSHSPAAYAEAVRTLRALGDPRSAAGLLREGLSRHPASRDLRALARG